MKYELKPVRDQVIVITGATSGIGLATARQAARRGASVVLNARAGEDLAIVTSEIAADGGQVAFVAGDVADLAVVRALADAAVAEFGRIDTWVNNAGVSIYGKLVDVPMEDKKRLFDTNFWGVVNGCRTALRHFERRGGTIIN
ncbi:MAG: SDR family NAD(P)-dependent oxidoreductase, partial [Gemmatimonadaceae bacterium]